MKKLFMRASALGLLAALALAGCGGGGGSEPAASTPPTVAPAAQPTVTISGIAAVGAALEGAEVEIINGTGRRVTTLTARDGRFSGAVIEAAPYLLRVAAPAGQTLYSFAAQAGNVNITPLTTLALSDAVGNRPLADIAASWAQQRPTEAQVLAAASTLNARLAQLMRDKGLDPATLNVFTAPFEANHTGLDAVLDALRVSFNCTAGTCSSSVLGANGQPLVNWSASVSTTGINLSWTSTSSGLPGLGGASAGSLNIALGSCKAPVAGTWSVLVKSTVAGLGALPLPEVCIDGVKTKPATQAEFCAGDLVRQQMPASLATLSCTYAGDVGTVTARLGQPPLAIDYSVSFTFVRR